MEGQSDYEKLLWAMPSNFDGNANYDSLGTGDDPNQHFAIAAGKVENQSNALPLLQWTHCQKALCNYVDFIAESSTFLEHATGADMLETLASPVSYTQSVYGDPEIQTELLSSNLGGPCGYKPADPSLDMDALKVIFQSSRNKVESANNFMSFQPQILSQNHTSGRQELYQDNSAVSQLHPKIKVSPSFILSKPHSGASRRRSAISDRYRRLRIAEKVRALQELLPHSVEGNQAAVMDDIIDYIKFLQLQLKELSQSRLGGQPASTPFVFLEDYGHYVLNEQMTTNEPLEEMLGKLLKMNPSAASQLLESRGFYMMPMSLVEG